MGGAYHVFFIWLKQGVGCGLSSRPPSKSKGNCTAGGRAIIVYRRVTCSAWKCVYIRRRNIDVEYGCFVFCLFVPPHRCGSTREAMRNGEKVVIVSIIDKRRIISQQSGSRNGLKGPRRSPHKFFYFLFFFFLLPAAGELYDFSDFRREEQRRSAVHVYRGGMDKQHQHVRCCAANKPPRWPDDSGYTRKWVKTRKARENAGDAAEDSRWRNCVYFKLELFLLADLLHSASFFCFSHQILQCLMSDWGDFRRPLLLII